MCRLLYLWSIVSSSKLGLSAKLGLKSRVSNFSHSFPRVYRGPIEIILGIFGRKFSDSWRSPIDFCAHAYLLFLLFQEQAFDTFWLHDFCISLATRVNSAFVISLVADFIMLVIFTSLSFSWSTIFLGFFEIKQKLFLVHFHRSFLLNDQRFGVCFAYLIEKSHQFSLYDKYTKNRSYLNCCVCSIPS